MFGMQFFARREVGGMDAQDQICRMAAIMLAVCAACLMGCREPGERPIEAAAPTSLYLSPECLAAAPDGTCAYLTCATAQRVMSVAPDGSIRASWKIETAKTETPVPVNPTGLAVAADGDVWVTGGVQNGELQRYTPEGKLRQAVSVGHSPCAPVVSPDGRTVYVLNRFPARISAVDVARMTVVRTWPALREPVAAALGEGGRLLFVANMLPHGVATNEVVSAAVTVVAVGTGAVRHLPLPDGSTGVRGLCASPDGRSIYVTHTMGRYNLPTTQLEHGWMNTAALSLFDGVTGAYINTVLLDDVERGAANPWGVAVTADGRWLCVAHAGTRELSLIDRGGLHRRLDQAAAGEALEGVARTAGDVPNDLTFLAPIRRRVKLGGDGPRGVAAAGGKVLTALYFADALAVVDPAGASRLARVGPERDVTTDRVRRGEMLYNDASLCFQQWQSCASCHPDGRTDGLNWDLLNDGVGNPKQSKSELYSQWTPPTMVTGIRKDMHTCNRAGLVHIQFVKRPEEDVDCLDAYCTSLKPVPSPYLVNGRFSPRAERGRAVFAKARCDACHSPEMKGPGGETLWTNLAQYDVGLGLGPEKGRRFDTPTLTECWRTAPYLYDGRALTMRDVLTLCNPDDTHGETQGLTESEIDDLAEYVLSL